MLSAQTYFCGPSSALHALLSDFRLALLIFHFDNEITEYLELKITQGRHELQIMLELGYQ